MGTCGLSEWTGPPGLKPLSLLIAGEKGRKRRLRKTSRGCFWDGPAARWSPFCSLSATFRLSREEKNTRLGLPRIQLCIPFYTLLPVQRRRFHVIGKIDDDIPVIRIHRYRGSNDEKSKGKEKTNRAREFSERFHLESYWWHARHSFHLAWFHFTFKKDLLLNVDQLGLSLRIPSRNLCKFDPSRPGESWIADRLND